jgi:hypothetical protein
MKTLLKISAMGILLAAPAIAGASAVNFQNTGSCYTLLFDPNGGGQSNPPKSYFYRSYDCKIGSPYLAPKVTITPPNNNPGGNTDLPPSNPPGNNPPANNNPDNGNPGGNNPGGNNGGNNNPPPSNNIIPVNPNPPVNPVAAVPAPEAAPMAGLGLGVVALFGWVRSRRQARA